MLFSNSILGYSFLFMLYVGICVGVIYDTLLYIRKIYNTKLVTIFTDIIFASVLTIVFVLGLQFCNYGQFRVFLLLTYIFGFVLQKITMGDLVAKFIKFIYNLIIKIFGKRKNHDRKQTKTNG